MRLHPGVPPLVARAPGARVQVEGAEVQVPDLEIRGEVQPFAELVRVRAVVALQAEPLVAERDHVRRVERLDVRGGGGGPGRDDGRGAPVAPRLVGELPGEDRGRGGVPRDDGADVRAVLGLCGAVGVPGCLAAAEGGYVL